MTVSSKFIDSGVMTGAFGQQKVASYAHIITLRDMQRDHQWWSPAAPMKTEASRMVVNPAYVQQLKTQLAERDDEAAAYRREIEKLRTDLAAATRSFESDAVVQPPAPPPVAAHPPVISHALARAVRRPQHQRIGLFCPF